MAQTHGVIAVYEERHPLFANGAFHLLQIAKGIDIHTFFIRQHKQPCVGAQAVVRGNARCFGNLECAGFLIEGRQQVPVHSLCI